MNEALPSVVWCESARVVFLDFDGVLSTPATRFAWADGPCVAALNRITQATGAEIVVTSSHRSTVHGARVLLAGWGATGTVRDVSPRCGVRSNEIRTWLAYNPVNAFVILDDWDLGDNLAPHLVRTSPQAGLTEADADRAIAILTGAAPAREGSDDGR